MYLISDPMSSFGIATHDDVSKKQSQKAEY